MRIASLLTLAAATLALAGCDSRAPEDVPVDNESLEAPVNVPIEAPAVNEAVPTTNDTVELPPPAPPPAFSDEQQIQDDADATGLTARLPDGEDTPGAGTSSGETGNQTGPVE